MRYASIRWFAAVCLPLALLAQDEGSSRCLRLPQTEPVQVDLGTTTQDTIADRAHKLAQALWAAQDADGAWRSKHYAMLADGPCLTAVVLAGLVTLPLAADDAAKRKRAVAFLRRAVDHAITYQNGDLPGYPTYSAAFALLALVRMGDAEDRERIAHLVTWLRTCQRQEEHGIDTAHVAYGGWGFGPVRAAGAAGHTDLAHTRWALSALAEADALDAATRIRAGRFLARCQRRDRTGLPAEALAFDGGFYLSPVVWPANKGGPGHWSTSYASTTADGAIALQLCGEATHAAAALAWLDAHDDWRFPAGIPTDGDAAWHESVRCYHLAARAMALRDQGGSWRADLLAALPTPRADGLYANPKGFLMKEDDPLVASSLLLHALAAASPTLMARR